jgi:hypothetical protein
MQRSTCVSSYLTAIATVVFDGRSFTGNARNHIWHNRPLKPAR